MLPVTLAKAPLTLSSLHTPLPGSGEADCEVTSGKRALLLILLFLSQSNP